jgi:hypothetical protein
LKRNIVLLLAMGLALTLAAVGPAVSAPPPHGGDATPSNLDDFFEGHHGHQHGETTGHLAGGSQNVDVVGKVKLTDFAGDISDVSALQASDGRWMAYLGDWGEKCESGGVHVVDFTDPANPVETQFLNSSGFGYVTEGVQALSIDTTAFTGDILMISNEWCRASSNPKNMPGGITIYDITNPGQPKLLVEAFGDFDLHGSRANESHSTIAWDAGDRAFAAAIDNEEVEDVDLFEITDPSNPVLLSETELPGVRVNGFGDLKTSHDFDVLQFPDGTWHLMVSDWDGGWVDVNVTDPANPVIVSDFDYAACDQVIQAQLNTCLQPEGNAHQGEWNSDGSVFVGTDEDFSPHRSTPFEITSGPNTGVYPSVIVSGAQAPASLPDLTLNGPVVYGGYGCPNSAPIPSPSADYLAMLQPGEEKIIVLQRGPSGDPSAPESACFPGEKAHEAVLAGWDSVLFVQRHDATEDPPFCGSGAFVDEVVGVCTNHEAYHKLFDTPPLTGPWSYPDGPAIGTIGERISVGAIYDGWGYVRVLDTSGASSSGPGKGKGKKGSGAPSPAEISQITIPETMNPAFSFGFGDLTVHEVEVPRGDPNEGGPNADDDVLAYFSWYSGGFRVFNISDPANPQQVGFHVDPDGNNFWGVALAEDQNGDRIVLASDRDFGLFIYRYTGAIPTP